MTLQELRELKAAKAVEYRAILDGADGRAFTEEESAKIAALQAEMIEIDDKISAEIALLQSLASNPEGAGFMDGDASAFAGRTTADEIAAVVFHAWLQNGDEGVAALPENVRNEHANMIRADQTTTTEEGGGALVPTSTAGRLLVAMASFGGMRPHAEIWTSSDGRQENWPKADDTTQEGEWLSEAESSTVGDTNFGLVGIGAHDLSSKEIIVPLGLLRDSVVTDLEPYLNRALALRLSRTSEKAYANGDGNGKPKGLMPNIGVGHQMEAGFTTSLNYNAFVEMEHSIDPLHRNGAVWMLHDTVAKAAKKLRDADGRPLWVPSIAVGAPDQLLGYDYEVNQSFDEIGANAAPLAFGNMKHYLIRDVNQIMFHRLADSPYIKKRVVGFLAHMSTDGAVIAGDTKSLKKLQMAAA